jgi:hypothetical protein
MLDYRLFYPKASVADHASLERRQAGRIHRIASPRPAGRDVRGR